MLTILFPRSSCRSNVPKELNCFPTREGKLISSSCGKVGLSLTTAERGRGDKNRVIGIGYKNPSFNVYSHAIAETLKNIKQRMS